MKHTAIFSVLAGIAAVGIAQSVDLTAFPACSLTCLSAAIGNSECSIADTACQCGPERAKIEEEATPCIEQACEPSDQMKAANAASSNCAAATSGGSSASRTGTSSSASSTGGSSASAATTGASTTTSEGAAVPAMTAMPNMAMGALAMGMLVL